MSRADDERKRDTKGEKETRGRKEGRKEKTRPLGREHERVIIIAGGNRLFLVPLALSRSFLLPRTHRIADGGATSERERRRMALIGA